MAWQRKIPFGYTIRDGELTVSAMEADAVKNIYALDLDGLSYSKIAEEMMRRGIQYHQHTPEWNKHMVKRILENQKYLGADGYPRLIPDEDFLTAQFRREDKTTYTPCPAFISPIREKSRCGDCGAQMTRNTKSHGRPRWCCENASCGNTRSIRDEELRDAVEEQLRRLAAKPHLLNWDLWSAGKETSLEPVRLENEINHEFNRADASPEYLRVLILACVTEKYNELPDPTPRHRLCQLRERLENGQSDEAALHDLLTEAVRSIRITRHTKITLELMNGQIFEREEARQ